FLDAKAKPEELITYVNTVLAEEWTEPGETASVHSLMARREAYTAVPSGVLTLVAGVDVQVDRIEVEILGVGRDNETWSIDYEILFGNPVQDQVWRDLERFLSNTYQGKISMPISAVCVDSGNWASEVYKFISKHKRVHWYAVKGVPGKRPIVETRKDRQRRLIARQKRGTAAPELVGNDQSCIFMYHLINTVTEPGPGFQHFPEDRDEEYFLQLTAMTARRRYVKGHVVNEIFQEYARAEAHDCRKYAYAAYLLLNPDLDACERLINSGQTSPWAGLKR
ncbi:MAG: phage terminase large subunit family protein, partial [Gammaproteobacteria bacterium]|nr:phage terminase large subunit family protein [Gammaproteobacteria bacterium]